VKTTQEPERGTYSIPEAAVRLGISRGHAFELVKRGELPGAIRLGGRIVVSRAVLDRVLSGESAKGEGP
jgi:excisionase family DNA binding protein